MNEISVGAVGAAVIAGLVSMLGLIIGKEQKVSEFRQAWINELRKCVVDYLVSINAICDSLSVKTASGDSDQSSLLAEYKRLNEASHGITLRVNNAEEPAKVLLASMKEFEELAANNATLKSCKIKDVETRFIEASKVLLKFEWARVKRGEKIYIWTKRSIFIALVGMLGILGYAWYNSPSGELPRNKSDFNLHLVLG